MSDSESDSNSDGEEYARQRAEKIRKNRAALESIGMFQAKAELSASVAAQKAANRKPLKARASPSGPVEPIRRSGRDVKRVDYSGIYDSSEGRGGRGGGGRRGVGGINWDNTTMDGDLVVAAQAAAQAASQQEANSKHDGCVKVLLPSHVSGGFWLQLPAEFADKMPPTLGKKTFDLQVCWPLRRAEGASGSGRGGDDEEGVSGEYSGEVELGDSWEQIWLRKQEGNGGLSGGWRGFAIDHQLATGDVMFFELVEHCSGREADGDYQKGLLRGTVYRAVELERRVRENPTPDRGGGAAAAAPAASPARPVWGEPRGQDVKGRGAMVRTAKQVRGRSNQYRAQANARGVVEENDANVKPAEVEYEVEELLGMQMGDDGKTRMFLCSWKGYGKEADTWEPESHLAKKPNLFTGYKAHVLPHMPASSTKKKKKASGRTSGAGRAPPNQLAAASASTSKKRKSSAAASGGAKKAKQAAAAAKDKAPTVGQLKEQLRALGLSAAGKTAELQQRLAMARKGAESVTKALRRSKLRPPESDDESGHESD